MAVVSSVSLHASCRRSLIEARLRDVGVTAVLRRAPVAADRER